MKDRRPYVDLEWVSIEGMEKILMLTKLFRKSSSLLTTHWHRVATTGHVEHLSALHQVIDRTVNLCRVELASWSVTQSPDDRECGQVFPKP